MDDLTPEQIDVLKAEVENHPQVADLQLPDPEHVAAVGVAGAVFRFAMGAAMAAQDEALAMPNDQTKASAFDSAAVAANDAQAELDAANGVVEVSHRAIDQAGYVLAAELNGPVDTGEVFPAGPVPMEKIIGALVAADLGKLTDLQTKIMGIYFMGSVIDSSSQNVRDFLFSAFPAGTATNANLHAAMDRPATRAELLFGLGARVEGWDVARAIRASKTKKGG